MTASTLWDMTQTYLEAEHLELDDLEVVGKGNARTVKVIVDGESLDLDRIAEVSRGLSRLFDAEYETEDSYQLEVSSPGLERALKRPTHFIKAVGKEISLKARRQDGSITTEDGVIVSADEQQVTVEFADRTSSYAYDDVIKARTKFRWDPSPKPGK